MNDFRKISLNRKFLEQSRAGPRLTRKSSEASTDNTNRETRGCIFKQLAGV